MTINNIGKIIDQKSIGISGDVHTEMKDFCKKKNINISWLTEQLFLTFIKDDKGNVDKLKRTK